MKSWRDYAAPIIAQVIKENRGKDMKEIRKALRQAYPFGERKYHPYKIWCDEVAKQLGLRTRTKIIPQPPEQTDLFK